MVGISVPLLAQGERSLHGTVTDAEGVPMPYVNVFVKPLGNKGTTTNEKGRFELSVDPSEADSILFRYTGYREESYPIEGVDPPIRVSLEEREVLMATTTITEGKDPDHAQAGKGPGLFGYS